MDDNDRFDALVFGRLVKVLRNERGLNQTDFGELMGMSQVKISRIEKGQMLPDASLTRKVAASCDMSRRELMTMYEDAIERTLNQAGTDPELEGAGGKTWMLWAAAGVAAFATAAVLSYLKDDRD